MLWLESAGLSSQDLDNDGKVFLVSTLLIEHQWEKALDSAQAIGDASFYISPALAQISAFAFLVNAIKAVELRESVLAFIPLAADKFPLADDSESTALRNRAVELFKYCSGQARHLGAEDVANISDKYVLWLQLRNSETHEQAISELESYFVSYTQKTLENLSLAFAFGIEIDFDAIEKEVNRQTALSPENDATLGLARFVLAQVQQPISAAVDYINRHRTQMEAAVNSIAISMLEIEALAKSGLVDDAQQLLQKVGNSGASDADVRKLQNIIESVKGADPVALAISQYQQSEDTTDLAHLVNLLERTNRGSKYYSYCRDLFYRTGQETDAIRVCNAACLLGRFAELHQFLLDKIDLVKRSERLQAHWAWSLFRKGDLIGAHEQIVRLKQYKSQQTDLKTLEINLSIFGGDWESLSIFVEDCWNNRDELKANDLLQAAQLAKAISPRRARQMMAFVSRSPAEFFSISSPAAVQIQSTMPSDGQLSETAILTLLVKRVSMRQIACQTGYSIGYIKQLALRHNQPVDHRAKRITAEVERGIWRQAFMGGSRQQIAHSHGVSVGAVEAIIQSHQGLSDWRRHLRRVNRLREHRVTVAAYLAKHADASRGFVEQVCRTAFTWLYKHDRAWLYQQLPAAKRAVHHPSVDWEERDRKLAEQLGLLAEQASSLSALERAVDRPDCLMKYKTRLPLSYALAVRLVAAYAAQHPMP